MKKILSILIVVLLFGFIPYVHAENFASFSVRTSFSEDIDLTKIQAIYVLISVPGEEDYREIELENKNMFDYETKDMPNTDIKFDSAYVAGDTYGKYTLSGELKKNTSSATLTIHVSLTNKTTTTTKSSTKAVTSEVNNPSDDVIIVDDSGNIQTTEVSTITITTETKISEAAKARKQLYKYVFIVIGLLLLFVVFIILVKIVRTNNLM